MFDLDSLTPEERMAMGFALGAIEGGGVKAGQKVIDTVTAIGDNAAAAAGTTATTTQTSGGTANAASGAMLGRVLSSEEQLSIVLSGNGTPIAGSGSFVPLRDSPRLVSEYGGKASDWSKVRSESYVAADGTTTEIHAYQNTVIGKIVKPKTIVVRGAK